MVRVRQGMSLLALEKHCFHAFVQFLAAREQVPSQSSQVLL